MGERIAAGIDVVTFSGDKLLGGAQAGFIVGKASLLGLMSHHPLLRAVRIDKLTLAAVEGTLLDYALGQPQEDIPVQRMLRTPQPDLEARAGKLAALLKQAGGDWTAEVRPINSQAGGGTLPGVDFASFAVRVKLAGLSAGGLERRLRLGPVPVIARVQEDSVWLDVRCLTDAELIEIAGACAELGREVTP